MDSLIEVLQPEWTDLIEAFKESEHTVAITMLMAQIHEKDNLQSRLYLPFGDKREGFIILWNMTENVQECCIHSPKRDPSRLLEALRQTKLINWKNIPILFSSVSCIVKEHLEKLLIEFSIPYLIADTVQAHISWEKAERFQIEIPEGVVLKQPGIEYAVEINEMWLPRFTGSVKYFEQMLRRRAAVGIFGKHENDLRGWVFISGKGDLHSLYVKEEHRRKGYAQTLIKMMSKEAIKRNYDIYGCINVRNEPSKTLFTSLGFSLLSSIHFIPCNFDKIVLDS